MATTIKLSGRLADITSAPISQLMECRVKAPAYAPGPGVEITTSAPQKVDVAADGAVTISVVEGVGWIYLTGPGWTESIRFVAAAGMSTLWEAVVNASQQIVEVKRLLNALYEAYAKSKAGQALPPYLTEVALSTTYATKQEFLVAIEGKVAPLAQKAIADYIAGNQQVVDAAKTAVAQQIASASNTTTIAGGDESNASKLVKTNSLGKLIVRTDSITAAGDVVNKSYVDTAVKDSTWNKSLIAADTDLNSFLKAGISYASLLIGKSLINAPDPIACIVTVEPGTSGYFKQTWFGFRGVNSISPVFYRWTIDGGATWSEWKKILTIDTMPDTGTGSSGDGTEPLGHRLEVMKQRSRIRRGGIIGTGGATPVALTFDHGFGNFRDKVIPVLKRLGLPATIAFNNGQMTNAENGGMTNAEIQTMCLNNGIELAHHAISHLDVPDATTNIGGLVKALLSSKEYAADQWPELVADSFIMPGISGTRLEGFNAGEPVAKWWEHPAGRLLTDNFPVISGTMPGYAVPMNGGEDQTWTAYRWSWDTPDRADTFKQYVQALTGSGLGIATFMHPSVLDTTDKTSTAKLTQILEWLAAERDLGRVEILTLSGWAYADTGTSRRIDFAPASWSTVTTSIAVSPLFTWVCGGQLMIETTATATGQLTMTATSDKGGLDARVTHQATAGKKYRLVISVPASATTLTVAAPGSNRRIIPT